MNEPITLVVEDASLRFEAAHFLVYQDGRCDPLHGHSFRLAIEARGKPDADGLVVDFVELLRAGRRLCDAWDHRMLLPMQCPLLQVSSVKSGRMLRIDHPASGRTFTFALEDVVALPLANVSAEKLAEYAAQEIRTALAEANRLAGVESLAVRIEEGPGYTATFRLTV